MNTKLISVFVLLLSFLLIGQTTRAEYSHWRVVGKDRQANISGMALIEHTSQQTSFLVVHDNKKKKQARTAIVTVNENTTPRFTALKWLGNDVPVDLEAITAVPGTANNFMASTSAGKIFHIELDRNNT